MRTTLTITLLTVGISLTSAAQLSAQDHRLPLYPGAPPNSKPTAVKEQVAYRAHFLVHRVTLDAGHALHWTRT